MNRIVRSIMSLVVLLFFVGCSTTSTSMVAEKPKAPAYWPTDGWRTSNPEDQGMDSEVLAGVFDYAQEKDLEIHSILVIRNGHIVLDAYFHPYAPNTRHDLASVTKSFTSTLIGLAIENGYIEDVNQPVLDFFPERTAANVDAKKKAMTVEDLLTMRTGMACYYDPGEITLFQMMQSPDWTQFMLDLPMLEEPGTRFEYCSGGIYLLAAIIREATGMSALDFAHEHLFRPLGITDAVWPTDPQGVNNTGWGSLQLSPHDMAKLGYLFLNDGVWDGDQMLSADWIVDATADHVSLPEGGYGYNWWIRTSGDYSALGRGGQMIHVLPDSNMVVAFTAGIGNDDPLLDILNSHILPAIKSEKPLPANSKGIALLKSGVQEAGIFQSQPKPVSLLPEMAKKISGRKYELSSNMLGITALSLTFQEEEALLSLFFHPIVAAEPEMKSLIGLDDVPRMAVGRYGLPSASKGQWESGNVFVANINEVANINNWTVRMTFEGDEVSVVMEDVTGLGSHEMKGKRVE